MTSFLKKRENSNLFTTLSIHKFEFLRENAEPKEEKFFFFQATNETLFKLVKKPNNEKAF